MDSDFYNLYAGNILVDRLRPPLSREEALNILTYLPPVPTCIAEMPRHVRLHHLQTLRELHVPTMEEAKLLGTVDLITFDSYRLRDPKEASNWASFTREKYRRRPMPPALPSLVAGFPGTGKTCSMHNILNTQNQIILHENFPMSSKPLQQLVWLSCEVPASGRAADLATALMYETDRVCGTNRFSMSLSRGRAKGLAMLEEWRQAVSAQFLGVLHLDEIQNLFKIPTLARRRSKSNDESGLQLAIVEDECLRWLLNFMNNQIASVYSGTPDGVSALTTRFATSQRFATGGYHHFRHIETSEDEFFKSLLEQLMRYQFVAKPIELNDAFAELILELSGGILRIIIALWFAAHRVAFERKTDDLRMTDFKRAADTYLAPLKPAIAALRSRDPKQLRKFPDMLQDGEYFWASFWQANA